MNPSDGGDGDGDGEAQLKMTLLAEVAASHPSFEVGLDECSKKIESI